MSLVLCSFLIGHRYDAYVVSGYASRELCFQDQSLIECPFKLEKPKEEIKIVEKIKNKYSVRPPPDLTSQYQKEMKRREEKKVKDEERKKLEEEKKLIKMLEKPPPDDLKGLRVHSWVLILPNAARPEISKPFFIEPSTGVSYPTSHHEFHGIESLWNHQNYWVNIQECTQGCKGLSFELTDTQKWEHLLPGEPARWRDPDIISQTDSGTLIYQEKHLDMPESWVKRLNITHKQRETKYPHGGKVLYYKKCTLEKYAPYVLPDGMVIKMTLYDDYEWSELNFIYQKYENRKDFLESIEIDLKKDCCISKYGRGRDDSLKEYQCQYTLGTRSSDRLFKFHGRLDCLVELKCAANSILEKYENRGDLLLSREAFFLAFSGPPLRSGAQFKPRKVLRVIETFDRDPEKLAKDDIRVRTFKVSDDKIHLLFHYEPAMVTARTREFTKPPISDTGKRLTFSPKLTTGYIPEAREPEPTQLSLFYMMEEQMAAEDNTLYLIRDIEKYIIDLLSTIETEQSSPELTTTIFNKNQNFNAKEAFLKKQQEMFELTQREVEAEVDFLSPFMITLEFPDDLSDEDRERLKLECLNDFKETCVKRANCLQEKFEKASDLLSERQQWFEENQDNLKDRDLKEYFDFVQDISFTMSLLQIRLTRLQINTAQRYKMLEHWLNNDPRLRLDIDNQEEEETLEKPPGEGPID